MESKIAQKIRFKEPQFRQCPKQGHQLQNLQYVFKDDNNQFHLHCQSCIEQLPQKFKAINLETIQIDIQSTSVQNFQTTYFEFEKMDSFIGKIANQFIEIAEQLTNFKSNFKKKWKAQLNHLIENQQKQFEQRLDDVLQSQTDNYQTEEERFLQQNNLAQTLSLLNLTIKKEDDKKYYLKIDEISDFLQKQQDILCNDELNKLFQQLTSINESIINQIQQIQPNEAQKTIQDMMESNLQSKNQLKHSNLNKLSQQKINSTSFNSIDLDNSYKNQIGDNNSNNNLFNNTKQKYKKKPESQPKIQLKELQQSLQNHTQLSNTNFYGKTKSDIQSKYIKKAIKPSKKIQKKKYQKKKDKNKNIKKKEKVKYTKDFEEEFDDSGDNTFDAQNKKKLSSQDIEEDIYSTEQDGTHSQQKNNNDNKQLQKKKNDINQEQIKQEKKEDFSDLDQQKSTKFEEIQKNKQKLFKEEESNEEDDEEDDGEENEDGNEENSSNTSQMENESNDSDDDDNDESIANSQYIPLQCNANECIMPDENENWLICYDCKKPFHSNCLGLNFWLAQTNTADGKFWRCLDCKQCYNCDEPIGDDTTQSGESRICKLCDKAFHQKCLTKKEKINKEGQYWLCLDCRKCPNCLECKRCKDNLECNNKKTACNNVIWNNMDKDKWEIAKERKRNCDKCWSRHQKKYLADNSYDYCFFCMKIHKKGSSKSCVCHNCNAWVHTRCDSKADEYYKKYKKGAQKYICPQCKQFEEKQNVLQVQNIDQQQLQQQQVQQ